VYQQNLSLTHSNLGLLFAGFGKDEEARSAYQATRDIQKKLIEQFPTMPDYRQNLARTNNNLGNLLRRLGMREDARAELQAARDILRKLVEQFPAVPGFRQELATTHNNLGVLLTDLKKVDEARTEYETARVIQKKLIEQFPSVPGYQQDLANADNGLGHLLAGLGKRDEARAEYRAARDIQRNLVEQFPAVPDYRQELAGTHNNLGLLLAELNLRDEARAECQAALDIRKTLVEKFPAVPAYQSELGSSYLNYGILIRDGGKLVESLEWFDISIRTLKPVFDREPRDMTAKELLSICHGARAEAYDRLQKFAAAVKDRNLAIELSPPAKRPGFRASRATSRLQAGMVADAVAEVAELTAPGSNAIEYASWNADQLYDFACVYAVASIKIAEKKQEYGDRAMELLLKAVKAGYKNAAHIVKDSDIDPLRGREDFKRLIVELETKSPPIKKPSPPPEKK
jgi:tetratricopeptide (TPR) repeat protein